MDDDTEPWSPGRQLLLQRCKSRALSCLNEHEYSRAFAHFIVALTVQPTVKGELLNAFLFTLEKLADELEKQKQVNEVLMCYQQALDVLPFDSHVLHGLATTLFRMGYVECAASYFLKSYQANPFFTPSLYCMENLKNALVERWHFVMLNDFERNMAYQHAIKRAVETGYNHVLDIGAGTGILSMMAHDAGAKRVYACEASEIMSAVMQSVMEANDKPIKVFQKFSSDLCVPDDLPEKVSLIVTEIFDAGLFGENSLETLNHAWEHLLQQSNECDSPESENDDSAANFLASSTNACNLNDENSCVQASNLSTKAKVIPYSATVYAVPVECEKFLKSFRLDEKVLEALDIKDMIVPQSLDDEPYSTEKINSIPEGYKMLSTPTVLLEANFNSPKDIKSLLQGKVYNLTYNCIDSGRLDAFVIWFKLHLDGETMITTAPNEASDSCCWEQAIFFVFPQYLKGSSFCDAGDNIEVEFLCRGHLRLQSVKISSSSEENNFSSNITMDPSLIYLLNSYTTGNVIKINLNDVTNVDNASILDISTFPVLSLKALKESSGVATVLRNQYQAEIEQIRDLYQIPQERLIFKSYEDLYKTKMQYDILIVDPVELCGLLKKNLLEDITMLRIQCLKDSGVVVPGEIEISAIIIESTTLKEQSKVVSDDKTAGFKISQIMNAYQCRIHQDIQFSTLPHQKLSDPIKLCHINLNSKSEQERRSFFSNIHKTTEVEVVNSGKVTAIIYWFSLKYHTDYVVDTSSQDSLYKQAACVLDDEKQVTKGERIALQWSLKNGCFQIGICDQETSVLSPE